MANGLAEYVVRLGVEADNKGLNQITDFLNSFRKSGIGIAAAVTAATTALYKFIETTTKQEFELRELAKTQGKTVEEMTKQDAVLKAMGKSLEDLQKDDKLKKTYEEIMKFNKELELPNASGSLKRIEELGTSFWKLKSLVNIAVSSIGKQLLINLEKPIKRITGGMDTISNWVRTNLNSISSKVSSVLTAFAKGIMGIGSVFSRIFSWIQSLPAGIKAIAVAIGALGLALSTGPIGQVLLAISAIGDLIHDYDNYKWNKQNAENPEFWAADNEQGWTADKNKALIDPSTGKPMAYQIPIGLEPAWEGYEKDGIAGVGKALIEKINEGLGNIDAEKLGSGAATLIESLFNQMTLALSGDGSSVFSKLAETGKTLGTKMVGFISSMFTTLGQSDIGTDIGSMINSLFRGIADFFTANKDNIASVIPDFIQLSADIGSGIAGLFSGIAKQLSEKGPDGKTGFAAMADSLWSALTGAIHELYRRLTDSKADDFIDVKQFGEIGKSIGEAIGSIIDVGIEWLETLPAKIMEWLNGGGLQELVSVGEAIGEGIIRGLMGLFSSTFLRILLGKEGYARYQQLSATTGDTTTKTDESGNTTVGVVDTSGYSATASTSDAEVAKETETALRENGLIKGAAKLQELNGLGKGAAPGTNVIVIASNLDEDLNDTLYREGRMGGAGNENYGYMGFQHLFKAVQDYVLFDHFDKYSQEENGILSAIERWNSSEHKDEDAYKSIVEFAKQNQKELNMSVITVDEIINSSATSVAASIQSGGDTLASALSSAAQKVANSAFVSGAQEALGGRFDKRQGVTVGEDGTEYIIPITKPARAAALLKQMFGEMGGAAVGRITKDLGLGIPGTNGAGGGSMSSALSGMQMANTYTINAPVTINVQSSGADAREIGARVYDLAERNLIKNLVGVNG